MRETSKACLCMFNLPLLRLSWHYRLSAHAGKLDTHLLVCAYDALLEDVGWIKYDALYCLNIEQVSSTYLRVYGEIGYCVIKLIIITWNDRLGKCTYSNKHLRLTQDCVFLTSISWNWSIITLAKVVVVCLYFRTPVGL